MPLVPVTPTTESLGATADSSGAKNPDPPTTFNDPGAA